MTARNTGPEREALIFNIQKYNTYDGPGVRTLIFLKAVLFAVAGVPIRKVWNEKYKLCSKRKPVFTVVPVLKFVRWAFIV